eukprot:517021-Rhodomonas_salina.1
MSGERERELRGKGARNAQSIKCKKTQSPYGLYHEPVRLSFAVQKKAVGIPTWRSLRRSFDFAVQKAKGRGSHSAGDRRQQS